MTLYIPHSKSGIQRLLVCFLLGTLPLLASCNRSGNELKSLQQQVWKNPKDAGGFILLGQGYARSERYSEAKEAYKNALAINPKLDDAYHALGALLSTRKTMPSH